jgi:hypothetical protein
MAGLLVWYQSPSVWVPLYLLCSIPSYLFLFWILLVELGGEELGFLCSLLSIFFPRCSDLCLSSFRLQVFREDQCSRTDYDAHHHAF